MNATVSDMLNMAAIGAHDAIIAEPGEPAARRGGGIAGVADAKHVP